MHEKESVKDIATEEVATRRDVHRYETMTDLGFIGLVATEIPEFIGTPGKKHAWRLPLFITSSIGVVIGAVMGWTKQAQADELREKWVEIEHSHIAQPTQKPWSEKATTKKVDSPIRSK